MNLFKFLHDYRIPFATRGKQISQGWIGLDCPFCGKGDFGLGVHIESGRVNCWRCGPHSEIDLAKTLLGLDYITVKEILKAYQQNNNRNAILTQDNAARATKNFCEYASDTKEMNERHRRYLESRNYDPDKLEREWNLKGTGNLGDYKFRIVAPITYKSKLVSYTCRDITGKSDLKWKTCKAENEVIPHKSILYGLDYCKTDSCLVVEGPGDVWRMGYNAVSTFGISFKLEQAMLLAERFNRVFILFDAEQKAQEQAHDLAVLLNARRVEVEILELDQGDPGEMLQSDADALMRELNLKE